MPTRRANPRRAKLHRSYTAAELAACLGVHKNTVRLWRRAGLEPLEPARPVLFQGSVVRAFLARRNARRKRPCPPGMLYCFRCRQPRAPALGKVYYNPVTDTCGNLRAHCEACAAIMYRRIRLGDLAAKMPGLAVQITQAPSRLSDSPSPSLDCDSERQVTT
jgi:hypothetical protein